MTMTEAQRPSRRLDWRVFERNRLTDDERRQFETEGILVLPGALSAGTKRICVKAWPLIVQPVLEFQK